MVRAFLRHHATFTRGKGMVGFIFTDEQWEHLNQRAKLGNDEFKIPEGLWPFVLLNFRKVLELDEFEPNPIFREVLWKPSDPKLIPDDVSEVDLSWLPIEVWHPESPPVKQEWPFPHPPVSDVS